MLGDIVGSIYEHANIQTKEFSFLGKGCAFTVDAVCAVAIADSPMCGGGHIRRDVQRHPMFGLRDEIAEAVRGYIVDNLFEEVDRFADQSVAKIAPSLPLPET